MNRLEALCFTKTALKLPSSTVVGSLIKCDIKALHFAKATSNAEISLELSMGINRANSSSELS